MIKAIHIKLLLLFSLSILFGHSAFGQADQDVCVGQEVTYHMYGFDGSSVQWSINTTPAVDITHTIDASNGVLHPPYQPDPNVPPELIYFKDSFSHTWLTPGTYTIQIVESNNSCDSDPVTFTVEVHALPDNTLTLSDPTICPSSSASIVLSNSVSGVNYQLRLDSDDSTVGGVVAGTGADISFSVSPAASTMYNVLATNANLCSAELADKANVTVEDVTPPVLADLSDLDIVDCAENETLIPQKKSFTGLELPAAKYTDNCSSIFVVEYRIQLPDTSFANAYGSAALNASSAADPSGFEFPEGVSILYFKVLDDNGNTSNIKTYTITIKHKPNPSEINF